MARRPDSRTGGETRHTAESCGELGETLTCWTIQPLEVLDTLTQFGSVRVDPAKIPGGGGEVIPPYVWLRAQLTQRITGYCGGLPWWAYCEKPDLRCYRHGRPRGTQQVRIQVETSRASVAILPFWAWNTVYCGQYLAPTSEAHSAWKRRLKREVSSIDDDLPPGLQLEVEASWEHLFDPELPVRTPSYFLSDFVGCRESASRMAVFETLRQDEVREVTHFTGASTCF